MGTRHDYSIDGKQYSVIDTDSAKYIIGSDYNSAMFKKTGYFERWGATRDEDPGICPIGPEILDAEISSGRCRGGCQFCYKGNGPGTVKNMTLETFKRVIDVFPKSLNQVALGLTDLQTNPDFIPIMEYCRSIGIVPNFTTSGNDLTAELAEQLAGLAGAVAVSCYRKDKNVCYNAIETFINLGLSQTNMHLMVSDKTMPFVYEVLNDIQNDQRLARLNAVVFLTYKPKGTGIGKFSSPTMDQYTELITYCLERNIRFGFDSCSAIRFMKAVEGLNLSAGEKQRLKQCAEPCESDIFSGYVNVDGEFWHCSFTEDMPGFNPVNMLTVTDFLSEVWYSENVKHFRQKLNEGCRNCPVYKELTV